MSFPSNSNDNDIVERFGRRFRYKASKGAWDIVSSPIVVPTVEAVPTTSSVAQADNLPMSGNEVGAMAYVQESNRLYVWNGSGWFEVALVNTSPTITAGGNANYSLDTTGTPTTITLTANDPEGVPITWSYSVTSGSLGGTTVSNVDNVFTITPSTNSADAGSFDLTFTASDGINIDTSISTFSLSFVPDWTAASLFLTVDPFRTDPGTSMVDNGFGSAVASSGNYAAIAAYREALTTGYESGAVHIMNITTGTNIFSIRNPSPHGGTYADWFGESISMDGNYLVIGCSRDDTASVVNAGRAYIYKTVSGDWTDTTLVYTLENPTSDAAFGWSVAVGGDTVVVGLPRYNGLRGRVYVYSASTGALQYTIDNPNAYAGSNVQDQFGWSVSTDGSKIVVGVPYEDDASGDDNGKAYVFNASNGALIWTLNDPNPNSSNYNKGYDNFGARVVISDGYIAISATREDDSIYDDNCGYVYVYNSNTGSLVYSKKDPNAFSTSGDDQFGRSLDISGDYLIVGANERDPVTEVQASGAFYVFEVATGNQLYVSTNPNAYGSVSADQFGGAVTISGFYAVVSAWREQSSAGDGAAGIVYIFKAG